MLLAYLEIAFGAILLLAFVTQVVVPVVRSTPLFPFLRTEKHLVAELERANEEVLEEALRRKIVKRHQETERLQHENGKAEVPPTDSTPTTQSR